jgi:hypothetical protein
MKRALSCHGERHWAEVGRRDHRPRPTSQGIDLMLLSVFHGVPGIASEPCWPLIAFQALPPRLARVCGDTSVALMRGPGNVIGGTL